MGMDQQAQSVWILPPTTYAHIRTHTHALTQTHAHREWLPKKTESVAAAAKGTVLKKGRKRGVPFGKRTRNEVDDELNC